MRISIRELAPVELQKFPHPYQAAFTVASDIDSASPARFKAVHALFCERSSIRPESPEWQALGLAGKANHTGPGVEGLGLGFADSFFLVGDPTTFGMYRYDSAHDRFLEDIMEGENCAALIRQRIKEGAIDCFHAFLHYTRAQIEPVLRQFYDWCKEEGISAPAVWLNHSAGVTPTGLCPSELQPNRAYVLARLMARGTVGPLLGRKPKPLRHAFVRYHGARPDSPYYINDLLAANGLKFVWLNVNDLHRNRAILPEQEWSGRATILRPVTMDDGVRYHRFDRCYGRKETGTGEQACLRDSSLTCDASVLITEKNLAQLCVNAGTCILYTHWTHYRSMPISTETIGRFRLLRDWQAAGKVWVTSLAKLLEWTRRRTFLDYTCSTNGKQTVLELKGIDDPLFGYEPLSTPDAHGLCFRVGSRPNVRVAVNGHLLGPGELRRAGDRLWLQTRPERNASEVRVENYVRA